jgi:glycogen operon protein
MTALFSPLFTQVENRWIAKEGAPRPLGSHHVPESNSYNFALYSKHASSVTLLLFASDADIAPRHEYRLDPLLHKSGRIWHCRIPAAQVEEAPLYGYRVDGPHELAAGHRFDPGKVLLDPFARAVAFPPDFSRMSVTRLAVRSRHVV